MVRHAGQQFPVFYIQKKISYTAQYRWIKVNQTNVTTQWTDVSYADIQSILEGCTVLMFFY